MQDDSVLVMYNYCDRYNHEHGFRLMSIDEYNTWIDKLKVFDFESFEEEDENSGGVRSFWDLSEYLSFFKIININKSKADSVEELFGKSYGSFYDVIDIFNGAKHHEKDK